MCIVSIAGTALGTVISMLLAGILAGTLGWASVFYVMGALSLVWCLLWVCLVADSPAQQSPRLITRREREYIQEAIHPGREATLVRQEASGQLTKSAECFKQKQ